MNLSARIISIIFHPLLLTSYLFYVLGVLMPVALYPVPQEALGSLLMLIFFMTFLLPGLNILFFKFFGSISSLSLVNRRERILPFIVITLLYSVVTYMFYSRLRIDPGDSLLKLMITVDLMILSASIITFFFKVSIHALGIWGVAGILFALNRQSGGGQLLYPAILVVLVCGLVMSARLQLQAHTLREVIVGSVVGLAIGYLGVFLI